VVSDPGGFDAGSPEDGGWADAGPADAGPVDGGSLDAGATDGGRPDGGACVDSCPVASSGITWGCEKRFMYGTNWAWRNFGGDFGGISAWGQEGVLASSAQVSAGMNQMRGAGVNVIRWWMFPRFFTDAITFGADDAPSGVGGSVTADVQEALRLAEVNDVYLMLTPFSFDSFTPTKTESGLFVRGLAPMILDAAKRQKLMNNLVKPVAQAVEASPYKRRMIAWDMINEPEWAMTGPNLYGGEAFTPQATLDQVTHAQMELFLQDMAAVLHANSSALVSIGGAAIKWPKAWSHVDVDFYQFHYYDWVYEWFPLGTATLASVGVTDKPVVMGEFPTTGLSAIPAKGLPARSVAELSADLQAAGYAGALSWDFGTGAAPWSSAAIKAFPDLHPCETKY
jgi:hypothetical protein